MKTSRRIEVVRNGRLGCALLLTASYLAQTCRAAPPGNDNFASRVPLSGIRLTVTGSSVNATLEPGEPSGGTFNSPAIDKTVWWAWTAPADGGVAASVIGSDFRAAVNIHTGNSISNLTLVSGDPWGPSGHAPDRTTARVTAGTEYQIAVGSVEGGSGGIVLELAFVTRGINDDFANRINLGSGNARAEASTFGATIEPPEWQLRPGSPNGTLWWSWRAPESGPVEIQVAAVPPTSDESRFGYPPQFTSLAVFTGTMLDSLVMLTNRVVGDEIAPSLTGVRLAAVAGTAYQLSVAGESGHLGNVELVVARARPPEVILTDPPNDSEFVAGVPVPVAAEAVGQEGGVTGIEFFVRGWLENRRFIQLDSSRPFRSVLRELPPDTYDLIARATDSFGIRSDSIPVEFNVRPINDAFDHRLPFAGAFVTVTGALANASKEIDEPNAIGQGSVWWTWTAPGSDVFTITASTEYGEAMTSVFTGSSLANLALVPDLDDAPGRVVLETVAGTSYSIAVSGYSAHGTFTLQVAQTRPPAITFTSPTNEMRIVEGGVVTLAVDATDLDGSVSEVKFFDNFTVSLGSVSNAPFALSTALALGHHFVHAVATDDHGVTVRSADISFRIVPFPPANDAFANRIPFTGNFVAVTGNTANATFEAGEESPVWDGSVWWEWTAPESGDYSITISATPGYPPSLAVFSGAAIGGLTLITNDIFYGFENSDAMHLTIRAVAGEPYQIAAGSGSMVRVEVAHTLPPEITLTSPVDNQSFVVGEAAEVRAVASDPDDVIARVEFYADGALLATVTNEPFVCTLSSAEPRYVRIRARAFDGHGVATISQEVRVLVRQPGPVNDDFADRISFTGAFASVDGSAANATLEPGEPYGEPGGTAWWSWTAPASGTFTIGARSEEGYWTSMAIYQGTGLTNLTFVTNTTYRGDVPGNFVQVVIEAKAGDSYPIAVTVNGPVTLFVARTTPPSATLLLPKPNAVFRVDDEVTLHAEAADADGTIRSVEFWLDGRLVGTLTNEPFTLQQSFRDGNSGHFVRVRATDDRGISTFSDSVYFEVRFHPPDNDDFADRMMLRGWFVTFDGVDNESTREQDEPALSDGVGSVWWRWIAPASGRVTLSCERSDGSLAVYRGSNLAELSVVASTQPANSVGLQLAFDATAGEDYAILLQSLGGNAGSFRLALVLDARELLGPRKLANGLFAFDLRTTFERTWSMEATTNLIDWTPLAAERGPDGAFEMVDPTLSGHRRQFYRAVAR